MIHLINDTDGDSNSSSSSSSSGVDRVREMEQELFVLLSHVVVAESHDDKARFVLRLRESVRRLEGELGIVVGSSTTTSTKDLDMFGPPVATVGSESPDGEEKGEEKSVPSSTDPIIETPLSPPKLVDGKSNGPKNNADTSDSASPAVCESKASANVEPGPPDASEAGDRDEIEVYRKLKAMTAKPTDYGVVEHKGKMVPIGIKPVLSHVVDSWKDHFSSEGPPKVRISLGTNNVVSFEYPIGGTSYQSDIFAMDGIYFDLTRQADRRCGYGTSSIDVLIPDATWNVFTSHFEAGTGRTPHLSKVTKDENQRLISVEAGMPSEDSPQALQSHSP